MNRLLIFILLSLAYHLHAGPLKEDFELTKKRAIERATVNAIVKSVQAKGIKFEKFGSLEIEPGQCGKFACTPPVYYFTNNDYACMSVIYREDTTVPIAETNCIKKN